MNGKSPLSDKQFVQEQLYETQRALFSATTVREIKFLQSKIIFLKSKAKEIGKR